jgi:hypothetical protein
METAFVVVLPMSIPIIIIEHTTNNMPDIAINDGFSYTPLNGFFTVLPPFTLLLYFHTGIGDDRTGGYRRRSRRPGQSGGRAGLDVPGYG